MTDEATVLDLNDAEQEALARVLRNYADMRANLGGGDWEVELRADLAGDPTYASDQDRIDQRVEQEAERQRGVRDQAASDARPYYVLADQVERAGRVDLSDSTTLSTIRDAIDDTGWVPGDEFAEPPAEMRRVVEAVAPVQARQLPSTRPADVAQLDAQVRELLLRVTALEQRVEDREAQLNQTRTALVSIARRLQPSAPAAAPIDPITGPVAHTPGPQTGADVAF